MSSQPLAFSQPEIMPEDISAVVRVLESGWITTGNEVKEFERELAEFLSIEHVVTVSSATTAEEICLAFLDLPAGSRVAVPAWTFVSTALAVERVGCVPVLIDSDKDTLNMDASRLEAAIAEGLDAVVGVHYSGTPLSAGLRKLCSDAGIPLVEDAAHAFGSVDDRGFVAGQGTAGACYSFYATKNLTTGEGGAIATDNAELAKFAHAYRLHGMSADAVNRYARPGAHRYDVTVPGLKANMPDVLAALGRSQLARFSTTQAHRRELVTTYRESLANTNLRFVPGDQCPGSADHLAVVETQTEEQRDAIISALTEAQIGSSVHFRPLHTFSWYDNQNCDIGPGGLPVVDQLDGRVMSLPLHASMSLDDVDRVCQVVIGAG